MSLSDEVEKMTAECADARRGDADLKRLGDFMEKMKQEGLLVKREYGLPLIDTIGRPLFQKSTDDRGVF